ncbi:MAG TPA: hypothetical protein VFM32_09110, partial [Spongiibacteraceae bacterium]|nr:hypothetical protein [Spongiibacteraceae bacterium]
DANVTHKSYFCKEIDGFVIAFAMESTTVLRFARKKNNTHVTIAFDNPPCVAQAMQYELSAQ